MLSVLNLGPCGAMAQFIIGSVALPEEGYDVREERHFEAEQGVELSVTRRNLWDEHW